MEDREKSAQKRDAIFPPWNEKGFTLVELLISLTIFAFGMLAVASMQTAALRGDLFARSLTEALRGYNIAKAEQLIALSYKDTNLSDDTDGAPTTHGPEVSTTSYGMAYTTSWSVEEDVFYTGAKLVTVTTSWKDQFGNHNVSTSFVKDSVL